MKIKLKDVLTIVLVVLCVGALVVVAKLSNNFTTDIKTFYVKVNGKMVTERDEFMLDDTAVEVCNVLNKITSHPTDFDVKIVRNTSVDSPVFYADGNKSTLADIADYTNCFEIMRTDNGFAIKSASLNGVLKKAFNAEKIELPPSVDVEKRFFTIVVSQGTNSILLDFGMAFTPDGITLDITEITF